MARASRLLGPALLRAALLCPELRLRALRARLLCAGGRTELHDPLSADDTEHQSRRRRAPVGAALRSRALAPAAAAHGLSAWSRSARSWCARTSGSPRARIAS